MEAWLAKEQKTAAELEKMISDELGLPEITIRVYPDPGSSPSSWDANAGQRGSDATIELRVKQIAEGLRATYDLEK